MNFNRKHFLSGAGSLIALPALESLGFVKNASAASKKAKKPPKRMAFLGFGYGVTQETWYPNAKQTGSNYTLPKGLAALKKNQKEFTIIQGCKHKYSREPHWGSTFWLTGANRYAVAGQKFSNTISVDQVAAEQLGRDTRFTSIRLCSPEKIGGHGPGLSLSWDKNGKPKAGIDSPSKLFHKLFSANDLPLEQRRAAIAENRSVLDTVLMNAKRVQKGLTKSDHDKLEEYFQSIRDIETQLNKNEEWLEIPKSKPPIAKPVNVQNGREEIEVMYKLMVAAMQTDSSRVFTYRQPVGSLLKSIDADGGNPHNISHYRPGPKMEASQMRDEAQSQLLSGLIDNLKATKEADGSSLYDNVTLAYGSNIRSIHFLDNCPTILAGGGANLKMGHHLVLKKDTPLNNVWLTMLNGTGIKTQSHGDSTGLVKELIV